MSEKKQTLEMISSYLKENWLLTLLAPPTEQKVLEDIRSWIQEQGIKIDKTEIKDFSLNLLARYDKRPSNCVKMIFEKDDNGVVRCDNHSR